MNKAYFALALALLVALGFPVSGQQVNIRGALSIGIMDLQGNWDFEYGGNFASPGRTWELALGGADPNTPFALCATKDEQLGSCTPNFGRTDQNGSWQLQGTFDAASAGSWTEWIEFPSGATSNRISFGIGNTYPTARLQINGLQAAVFHANQQWTLLVDQGFPHYNEQFDFCAEASGVAVSCTPNFGKTDGTAEWTLTGTFPNAVVGGWSEWIKFHDGTTSNRISFIVDDHPLDDLTCESGTIYPIGPDAGYANFPRYMPDWYPSDPGDYRIRPGFIGGYGNTLEYLGCQGGEYVWLQWAYTSFIGFQVRAPWGGQTDRGLRIGDSLAKFQSLYPAARQVQSTVSNATADVWDNGPLRIYIQSGMVAGIRVNWAISEFSGSDQPGIFILTGPPIWFIF